MNQAAYPVQFSVDYPDHPLDRVSTLLRLVFAVPVLIVLGAVSGETWEWTSETTTTVAGGHSSLARCS